MSTFSKIVALLALISTTAPLASAHSWIEEYQVIDTNGSFTGARGYSRGYMARTAPGYSGDSLMWMLPSLEARNDDNTVRTRINSSDLVCHPAQRTSNYTAGYPKLKVQPGDYVAMKYLENGHTTLPWNITGKPPGGGTVFVFGTTQAADDEKIADVMDWTTDGSGGNKRGFLMTAQNFDDGRCHQINCGSISQSRQRLQPLHIADQPASSLESWCETDLKIPENVAAGTLTTYWIWQWPTEPNADCNTPAGKDEYYTTCADFDVVAAGANNKMVNAPFSIGEGGNPQSQAVTDFKSRTAYTATPSAALMEHNKIVGKIASVDTAFVSSCSAQASIISANSLGIWPEVFVPNTCDQPTSFGTAAASAWSQSVASAYSSYSAGSSAAWSAAFAAAKVPMPSRVPWSQAAQTQTGTQVTATAAPAYSPAPTSYGKSSSAAAAPSTAAPPSAAPVPSSSAAAAPYGNSTTTAAKISESNVEVTTITTVVVLTSTLPAGQAAPSAPATSASSSSTVAAPNPYGISTVMTKSGAAPAAGSDGAAAYRRHARDVIYKR